MRRAADALAACRLSPAASSQEQRDNVIITIDPSLCLAFGKWQMAVTVLPNARLIAGVGRGREAAGGVTVKRRKKLAIAIDAVEKGCERRAS